MSRLFKVEHSRQIERRLPMTRELVVIHSSRKGGAGPRAEALGSVRRQMKLGGGWMETKAFTVVSVGRNGQGRVSWLGLPCLNNTSGLWSIGAVP